LTLDSSSTSQQKISGSGFIDKKDFEVLIGAIDRKIHRAIDTDQLIVLTAEVVRERLSNLHLGDPVSLGEYLESIVSKSLENSQLLLDIRRKLREQLLNLSKDEELSGESLSFEK
jgi:hypothetical protein